MPITVQITCAWCQANKETNLTQPVPEGWVTAQVKDPDYAATEKLIDENFCCSEHEAHYLYYNTNAHTAAAKDYKVKFYAEMNVLREKEKESPRKIVEPGFERPSFSAKEVEAGIGSINDDA